MNNSEMREKILSHIYIKIDEHSDMKEYILDITDALEDLYYLDFVEKNKQPPTLQDVVYGVGQLIFEIRENKDLIEIFQKKNTEV